MKPHKILAEQALTARETKHKLEEALKDSRLTPSEFIVLGYIYDAGEAGVNSTYLARMLHTSRAHITHATNALVAHYWIQDAADSRDQRANRLVFTGNDVSYRETVERVASALELTLEELSYAHAA